MEEQWYADRCRLRELLGAHPAWPTRQFAAHLGRSLGWVKKWRRRLRAADPADDAVLHARSPARKRPPPTISRAAVDRILELRDHPPANLHRVPGPRAILYYLGQDAELAASEVRLPRSTRTVWQILTRHGRIAHHPPRHHEPVDRPPPLTWWQLDFKDVSTVPADPDGKWQHVVEALNAIDVGTSILVDAQVRADFTAETALGAIVELFRAHGLPERITIDRDPRFVGAAQGRDFPSPFLQLLASLGVEVDVCPPQRPDRNGFIERYHRTYDRECLRVQRPATEGVARAVTAAFLAHYNQERPNQALACGNRPPRVAFPALPTLPPLPEQVDPDAWLRLVDGRCYVRKVRPSGTVKVEGATYYVARQFAGQQVALRIDAAARVLVVLRRQQEVKRLPLKALRGAPLALDDYLAVLQRQARARRYAPDRAMRSHPRAA